MTEKEAREAASRLSSEGKLRGRWSRPGEGRYLRPGKGRSSWATLVVNTFIKRADIDIDASKLSL